MGVATRSGVNVDVDQLRTAFGVTYLEAGLLERLAARTIPWSFADIDVPAGLQPEAETLVKVQHHTPRSDHDRGTGDMNESGIFAERFVEQIEMLDERAERDPFAFVDRRAGRNCRLDLVT